MEWASQRPMALEPPTAAFLLLLKHCAIRTHLKKKKKQSEETTEMRQEVCERTSPTSVRVATEDDVMMLKWPVTNRITLTCYLPTSGTYGHLECNSRLLQTF